LKQLHIHACPFVFVRQQSENPTTTNFPVSQSFYHFLHDVMSNAKLLCDFPNRYPSVFCDERVSFLLVAFRGGGSWSTAARQMPLLPSLKRFTQSCTLLASKQESP
jgi:hypothetical protein